ncbi:uncharacterized protein LOC111041404 [Myzus persicae]|uniref:uncharacterized protein LOC111041404 n=1 Tax=Myzus persicae TaxID=13164 RepID=UPI000B939680|nr:uncharacterized protein LOC111041404 [Myzus persicae]
MNGIIEYDQKLKSLPKFMLIHQYSPKKNYWNSIFIFTIVYYITLVITNIVLWPPKTINFVVITKYFFGIEYVLDVAVCFSTYFFLQQLEYRFQTLNESWKYLLPGFLPFPGKLTCSITGMTLDKIRLLHAELSDSLRLFSVAFGQILLGFFVFSYIDMLLQFYYFIVFDLTKTEKFSFLNFLRKIVPHIVYLKNVVLVLAIIIAASRVHEKKRKMISHLRLIRISNLSANLKIQVKLFMNQITVFESSEITAFGIFIINLNLVISILILLITGIVTLIQMKNHPMILQSKQSVLKFLLDTRIHNLTYN